MIALFIILYVFAIWLVFAKWRIKPTPTSIAAATVVGVLAVGAILVLWRFSAPMSGNLVVTRYTIQIVPQVKGPITKIHAEPNVPLTKGQDMLFEIQTDAYQYAVDGLTASLRAAEKQREQLQAGITVAEATIVEAEANLEAASADLAMAQEAEQLTPGAVSQLQLTKQTQTKAAAEAALTRSRAAKDQATAQLEAAESTIESLQANLAAAQFDLRQCQVYAPADGFVTNWQVREGTMAVPLPLAPLGTFVDTSRVSVVATFSQNLIANVQPGDKVELALKNRPGEVHTGTVAAIIPASGEGQFLTSGQIAKSADLAPSGKFAVKFDIDDEQLAQELPMGATGTVAIYTHSGSAFHVISRVTVRMKAWLYYLIPT
ncbi:MAG: secretion protein HlyD [Planctomycetaceae bacterium]|nr:secretion protein HlyD [Planctomycetaceae bacterium]